MLVFLSWSGARSKLVAEVLEKWFKQVIQALDPWISVDIEKGARWSPEIAERLEKSKVGILCLTKENLSSPWILFEAGALSKMKDAHVCTLLIDLLPGDVVQPLGQFQHTTVDKIDIYRLVCTMNKAVERAGERSLNESTLKDCFETYWPRLEEDIKKSKIQKEVVPLQNRPDREMLEEMLGLLRNQERRYMAADEREKFKSSFEKQLLSHFYSGYLEPKDIDNQNLIYRCQNDFLRSLLLANTEKKLDLRESQKPKADATPEEGGKD